MVTGATGALGGGVVATLLARGATVHAPMMEAEVPPYAAWRGSPQVVAAGGLALDDEAQVSAYVGGLPPLWASIHLVGGFAMTPIADTTLAAFRQQHTLNAVTAFLCCREAVRSMRRGSDGGRIVNVAALAGLLPGMGDPTSHRLGDAAFAVGRTLASLDLRGTTGATVLAVGRVDRGAFVPGPTEPLCAGDVLALAGSVEAVAAATALLDAGPAAYTRP